MSIKTDSFFSRKCFICILHRGLLFVCVFVLFRGGQVCYRKGSRKEEVRLVLYWTRGPRSHRSPVDSKGWSSRVRGLDDPQVPTVPDGSSRTNSVPDCAGVCRAGADRASTPCLTPSQTDGRDVVLRRNIVPETGCGPGETPHPSKGISGRPVTPRDV